MDNLPFKPAEIRTLIVDDHDLMRKSIAKVLTKMRMTEFIHAHNGNDAIATLNSEPIDLVICDLYMGAVSGFDVLDHLRNRDTVSDIPFLVVTGEAQKEDIVKAADRGAEDYLIKPFQTSDLKEKINNILTAYHSPSPLIARIRKAERLVLKDNIDLAHQEIRTALQLDPQSARANYILALIQFKLNNLDDARKILEKGINDSPNFLKNYKLLGDLLLKKDEVRPAISIISQELAINPKKPKRQTQLASLLLKSGDPEGAVEHFRLALLEDGKLAQALFGMGKAYASQDNLDKAVYYFKRYRRHHPEDSRPLEAIIKYSIAFKSPRTAEVALRDEKKNNPERLDTYILLAKFYASLEKIEPAMETINEGLEREPTWPEALRLKGALHCRLKDYEPAIAVYKEVLKIERNIQVYITLAEIYVVKEQFSLAISTLTRSLALRQHVPKIYFMQSQILAKMSHHGKSYFTSLKLLKMGAKDEALKKLNQSAKQQLNLRRSRYRQNAS